QGLPGVLTGMSRLAIPVTRLILQNTGDVLLRAHVVLGLKDNVFRWLTVGQGANRRWIFYGRGWGHGLGMCQTGAYGMALEGATFQEILQHYYPGMSLQRVD
ncbi:MAG: hypothetical protein ACHQX0_07920, partial [Desulfobaccales bacterium]